MDSDWMYVINAAIEDAAERRALVLGTDGVIFNFLLALDLSVYVVTLASSSEH